MVSRRLRNQEHFCLVALLGLKHSAIDGECEACFTSWKEISVRVRRGGVMLIHLYVRVWVPMSQRSAETWDKYFRMVF